MSEYLGTIAMPYIEQRLKPHVFAKISRLFQSSTLPDTAQTLREWQTLYEAWNKNQKTQTPNNLTTEAFNQLKRTFITLYTLSFSPENFPPVAVEPTH